PGLAEAVDKSTVGEPERPYRGVEALDPQRAEGALFALAVAVGVLVGALDRLLGNADRVLAPAVVALRGLADFLVAGISGGARLRLHLGHLGHLLDRPETDDRVRVTTMLGANSAERLRRHGSPLAGRRKARLYGRSGPKWQPPERVLLAVPAAERLTLLASSFSAAPTPLSSAGLRTWAPARPWRAW